MSCETMPDETLVKFNVRERQTIKLTNVKAWENQGIYSL